MFEDVQKSRELRLALISDPSIGNDRLSCPICGRRVWKHNSGYWTGKRDGEGFFCRIPCFRRNEWDISCLPSHRMQQEKGGSND